MGRRWKHEGEDVFGEDYTSDDEEGFWINNNSRKHG